LRAGARLAACFCVRPELVDFLAGAELPP